MSAVEPVVDQLRREFDATEVGPQPCPYPTHRSSDRAGDGGKRICGICHPAPTDPDDRGPTSPASRALQAARVDLLARVRDGIPPQRRVPGADWLLAGKRYLIPASAGEGKSLIALVVAVDVVAAGGRVAILDVENGADEYARRLVDVLADRPEEVYAACAERLAYFEWPSLSVEWVPADWAGVLAGTDLVVFDSSRRMLSAAGLNEDSNDDYSRFADALLFPLSRAGTTTVVLDNTGHNGDHARGASAKRDLNEVVYQVGTEAPFDRDRAGALRLVLKRSRFPDLPAELRAPIGGGTYGPVVVGESAPEAKGPTEAMRRVYELIEANPGIPTRRIGEAGGARNANEAALRQLIAEGYVRTEKVGQAIEHHPARPLPAGGAE